MPEQHGREVQPSLLVQGAHAAQKVLWKGMRSACSLCCEKGKERKAVVGEVGNGNAKALLMQVSAFRPCAVSGCGQRVR